MIQCLSEVNDVQMQKALVIKINDSFFVIM